MWYNSNAPAIITVRQRGIRSLYRIENPSRMTISQWKNLSSERLFLSIAESTVALHSFPEEQKLLEYALDTLLSLTEGNAGSILIWDEIAKELVLRVAQGPYRQQASGARVKLREGVSGWVADQGRSVLVKDVEEDSRFHELKRTGKYQSRSFISVPMLAGNKLVGVINITEKQNLEPFSEEDFERVHAMAKHVVVAYENVKTEKRLWHENEELTEKLSKLNELLRHQEHLVSIGKLAANLAHELNNPLDGIRRFINLSLDQVKEESLAREYLLKAKAGVRRAIQVIRGLLAFSSQTSRHQGKTSEIHRVIEESLMSAQYNAAYSGVQFQKKFCATQMYVRDSGLMVVFQNLFENACHAMNFAGTITVQTEKVDSQGVILVHDSGPGIPEEYKRRIFEPFFTTKPQGKGTGIGLSICRDIVERCGGNIACESVIGQGTTFQIKLPYLKLRE